jgi:hypothetical protein
MIPTPYGAAGDIVPMKRPMRKRSLGRAAPEATETVRFTGT